MPIISIEIMKTIDERELQKTTKENKQRQKGARGTEPIVNGWELKASLIFKSNLELALSIILKQTELYESKHVAVECNVYPFWYAP